MKEPLLKIHEITRIQQKYMILRGLFVKVTTFQLLRNNRRACAVNFDKSKVMKRFERTKEPLFKIHEITQIQQKAVILGEGGRGVG